MAITANGLVKLGFTPDVDFELQDDGQGVFISKWNSSSPKPSQADMDSASTSAQADYDALAYSRSRQNEYALVKLQLDMMYWDKVNGTTTWQDHVAAVKAKFPKG